MSFFKKYEPLILLVILLVYFGFRLFNLTDFVYNPDELEWIYCIKNAQLNWHLGSGFDSNTTGPISIWFLLIFNFIFSNIGLYELHLILLLIQFSVVLISFFNFPKHQRSYIVLAILCFISKGNTDFISYNTEWILFLFFPYIFKIISTKSISNKTIFTESFFIFSLFFIKFQFIPLAFLLIIFQFMRELKLKFCFKLISIHLSLFILFFLFFSNEELNIFYQNYVIKNIWHSKNMSNVLLLDSILYCLKRTFILFLPAFIFLFVYLLFQLYFKKNKNFESSLFINSVYLKATFLFFVLFVSIFLPRTNYDHYFIIIIYPFAFLLINIFANLNNSAILYFFIFIFCFFLNIKEQRLVFRKPWGYSHKYLPHIKPSNTNNKIYLNFHDSINVEKLDRYVLSYSSSDNKTKSIFIIGWFESLLLYYRYSNFYNPVFKSGHTFYLNSKDSLQVLNQNVSLFNDFKIKGFPNLIILNKNQTFASNNPISQLLKSRYIIKFDDDRYLVYAINE